MKKVFVLVRFSVLSIHSKGWELSTKSYNDYKNELYADDRLSTKIRFFTEITLASLDAQIARDNSNVNVYLVAGIAMPQKYKDILEHLKLSRPWLFIEYVEEDVKNIFSFFDPIVDQLEDDTIYSTVRLDDDDALSSEYFNQLDLYLVEENVNKVVSFINGIAGFWDQELECYTGLYDYEYPLIALGMAYIHKKGASNYSNIYNLGSHTKVNQRADVIYDLTEAMYIRTFHQSSDSFHKQNNAIMRIKKRSAVGCDVLLKHYPNINQYAVNALSDENGVHEVPLNKENVLEFNLSGVERLDNSRKKTILVVFTAAISNRASKVGPFFSGNNIARGLGLPLLTFADPLVSNHALSLGWYLGGEEYPNVQHTIANVIDYYMTKFDANAILLGGSGGGFTSLVIAGMMHKKVSVLAMNPQTDIFKYYSKAYNNYLTCAFNGVEDYSIKEKKSLLLRNHIKYYTNPSSLNNGNEVYYVQNLNDEFHLLNHFNPYIQSLLNNTEDFPNKNFNVVLEDFGEGHVAPSAQWIQDFIQKNILDETRQKYSNLYNLKISSHEISILNCKNKSIVILHHPLQQEETLDLYIVKNGKIKLSVNLKENVSIYDRFFEHADDLSDYKVNIFVSKEGEKLSKSFLFS